MPSTDDLFESAMARHQAGDLDEAAAMYRAILEADARHAGAHNALGMLLHQRGRSDEAVACIRRALELDPQASGFLNNLGNVYIECKRPEEALDCYLRAATIDPESAMTLNNLGHAYVQLKRYAEGWQAFSDAIRIDPAYVQAYINLALVCVWREMLPAAAGFYRHALELDDGCIDAWRELGRTYYRMKRFDKAATVYRQWIERDPENPVPVHMLAACSQADVPARAADAYVTHVFDRFASTFDQLLVGRLGYQAPQLCAQMLARWVAAPAQQYELLDAGCGTGLCSPLLRPWARRLHGVDLSRGMLDKAHEKAAYDEYYCAELTAFLRASPRQWDVVVSADTLCYFGDLSQLSAALSGSLRPGGVAVFTVEADDDAADGYALKAHGRYAHASRYVTTQLAGAGLELLDIAGETLRIEDGEPVAGWVVAARRPVEEAA